MPNPTEDTEQFIGLCHQAASQSEIKQLVAVCYAQAKITQIAVDALYELLKQKGFITAHQIVPHHLKAIRLETERMTQKHLVLPPGAMNGAA